MKCLFPCICSDDVPMARDFYVQLLGFRVVFENDWYVQLVHPEQPAAQLAFVERGHPSVPTGYGKEPGGVLVTVETGDVDALADRAKSLGHPVVQALRDEAWGQRHFMVRDPNGLLIDLVQLIPPTEEYAQDYVGTAG